MDGTDITDEKYRYGYQGQYSEKDATTSWNEFELRMYDARFGRWLSVDPEGQYASPYIGMGNNPAMGTDPDGGLCCAGLVNKAAQIVNNALSGLFGTSLGSITVTTVTAANSITTTIARSGAIFFRNEIGRIVAVDELGISAPDLLGMSSYNPRPGISIPETPISKISPVTVDPMPKYFNSHPGHTLTEWKPSALQRWGMSEGFLAKFTYDFADALYMSTSFFRPWDQGYHLDGQVIVGDQGQEALVNTAMTFLPAAGFSKTLKKGYTLDKVFGDQFARYIKTIPGKAGGASRKVYYKYKNIHGKTIKFVKDTWTKNNKFWERKPQPID